MIQTFPRSPTHSYKHSESCQTTMRNDRLPQSAKPTNVPANPHTSVRQQRFQDYQQRIRHLHLHLQQHIANTIPPAAVAAAAIIINSNDSNSNGMAQRLDDKARTSERQRRTKTPTDRHRQQTNKPTNQPINDDNTTTRTTTRPPTVVTAQAVSA